MDTFKEQIPRLREYCQYEISEGGELIITQWVGCDTCGLPKLGHVDIDNCDKEQAPDGQKEQTISHIRSQDEFHSAAAEIINAKVVADQEEAEKIARTCDVCEKLFKNKKALTTHKSQMHKSVIVSYSP